MKRYFIIILMTFMAYNVLYAMDNDTIAQQDKLENVEVKKSTLKNYLSNINYKAFLRPQNTPPMPDSVLKKQPFFIQAYKWVDKAINYCDSNYVRGTGRFFNFKIKSDNWFDAYYLDLRNKTDINMISHMSSSFGFSVGYRAVSLGYMFDVRNAFQPHSSRARHRMDLSFSCSRVVFEGYYLQNLGGTNIIKFGEYSKGKKFSYSFENLDVSSYGFDFYYIFNNKKYSYAAAYGYSRLQVQSAGSLFAGVSLSHHDIDLDFAGLPESMKEQLPENQYNYRFGYNDYSAMIGYGYNWVFKKNWLFSIFAVPSFGVKVCTPNSIEEGEKLFSANFNGKMSLIYNTVVSRKLPLFAGFIGQYNGHWFINPEYSFINSYGGFNFCVGIRF